MVPTEQVSADLAGPLRLAAEVPDLERPMSAAKLSIWNRP